MKQAAYRIVKSKLKKDIIIITLSDFGIDLHYKINHLTQVDPVTKYGDGELDYTTDVNLDFIKLVKHKNAKTTEEILNLIKSTSILPPDLLYDHILLGYVYADDSDPNNHRWWLDVRDSKNQSIFNYYGDKLIINCPVTTKAWHDEDPEGIWHGRMVFSKNEIVSIKEQKPGQLVINGKGRSEPIDSSKICSPQNIPKKTSSLRLRYNIREDIWFCDLLDKEDKPLGVIPCKSIICDAKMYSSVMEGEKPKVSVKININDISDVAIAINSLIIRGK